MADKSLLFDIFAVDRASKTFDKVADHADKMGDHFGKVGKVAAGMGKAMAGAVIGGVALLAGAFSVGAKEAENYQKITAQTNAVLKSTKGVSHETAGGIAELSKSISEYSGQSQAVVQQGANMLLTFKGIRNEAGKGNDIFNQSTKVLADMTTALGSDPQKQAIQLGKALNDPIKGISALQRVGVTFTDGQKKTIKSLVDSGHTMQAQKIILKELNSEFGGSAKAAGSTLAGSMNKLKNSVLDLLRDAITPLIPMLVPILQWMSDKIPKAIGFAIHAVTMLIQAFTHNGDMDGLPDTLNDNIAIPIINVGTALRGAFNKIKPYILQFVGWFKDDLVPAAKAAAAEVLPALGKALSGLGQGLGKLMPTFKLMGTILTVFLLPVLAKISQIVFTVLGPAFKLIGTVLNTIAIPALKGVVDIFLIVVGTLVNGAAKAFGWVPGIGGKLKKAAAQFNDFKDRVNDALNGVKKGITLNFHATMDSQLREILKTVGGQKGAALAQSIHGHTVNASGTPSAPGGMALVGEGGPELMYVPKGAQIKTASQTSRIMNAGGDFTASAPLIIKLDSGELWRGLVVFKRQSGRTSLGLA